MAQKIVGVDLGAHRVKVTVVSAGLRGVQVVDAFEVPVPRRAVPEGEDEQASDPLAATLAVALGALRSKRLLGHPLAVVLPPGLLSYRVLSFPFSDERRVAQTVAYEAEGQFPVPLTHMVHGHVVVPTPGGGGRALVVAARNERVDEIADAFRNAGADVKLITSGAVASAQVADASLPTLTSDAAAQGMQPASLIVEFGHSTTQMIALGPKGPLAVRTQRRGGRHITAAMARSYSMDVEQAETAKHTDAFVPHRGFDGLSNDQLQAGRVVAEAIEPIVRELQHTRLWLRSTYNLEVGKILVAGGGADLKGIDEYLAEQTELPVERLTPKASMVKGLEGRDWTSMCGALGAAYGAARRPLVQLHEAANADADGAWMQERMTSLVAMGVAIMAFGALDTIAQVKALNTEKQAYADQLASETLELFGEEIMTLEAIDAKLASVADADLTDTMPDRGALEVLAMVVDAATPSDLSDAAIDPATGQPIDASAVPPVPGAPPGAPPGAVVEPTLGPDGAPVEPEVVALAAVAADAGIVVADDLIIETLEIRANVVDLRASATLSSAQDRLNFKLKEKIGCISEVSNGKVKSTADRKEFDMDITHNCYEQHAATPQDEAEDGAKPDGADKSDGAGESGPPDAEGGTGR